MSRSKLTRLFLFFPLIFFFEINAVQAAEVDPAKLERAKLLYGTIQKAQAYYKEGRLDEAKREFRELIRLKPDYAQAYQTLGMIAFQEDDMVSAKEYLDQAVTLSPNEPNIHYLYASTLVRMNKLDAAAVHYQRTTELNPQMARAFHDYGMLRFRKGEYLKAVDLFEQARSIAPGTPNTLMMLGMAYVKAKKSERAIEMVLELRDLKEMTKADGLEKYMRAEEAAQQPPDEILMPKAPKGAKPPAASQQGAKKKPAKNPFQR